MSGFGPGGGGVQEGGSSSLVVWKATRLLSRTIGHVSSMYQAPAPKISVVLGPRASWHPGLIFALSYALSGPYICAPQGRAGCRYVSPALRDLPPQVIWIRVILAGYPKKGRGYPR